MVVTERSGGVMDNSPLWNPQNWDDDEDDSNSSDSKPYNGSGRKRKFSTAGSTADEDEREQKRRKNREAAKRCRDKKQQQTEDLRKKNGELEQENCQLVKQRDELIRKCQEYQQEIDQHKEQGCMVPHFDPPYDLHDILKPDTPPASLSPGPAPRVSPAPHDHRPAPCHASHDHRPAPCHAHHDHRPAPFYEDQGGSAGYSAPVVPPTLTPSPSPSPSPTPPPKVHFLRVKKKDGSTTTLQLSHEDYLKVSHRLQALKAKKQQQQQQQQQQHQQQQQRSLGVSGPVSGELPFMPQMPHDPPVNPQAALGHRDTEGAGQGEGEGEGGGQKLDTVEDLLSVLKNNVKSGGEGRYELVPVNPNDVLPPGQGLAVKVEPADSGYEQHAPHLPLLLGGQGSGVKREAEGQWLPSVGETIRAGMDTLTHDDTTPTTAHINNIVHFLEHDDQFTVTVTDPVTSRVLEQTTAHSAPRLMSGSNVRQVTPTTTTTLPPPHPPLTYVMTSAPMGSLGVGQLGSKVKVSGSQGGVAGSAMQNVKLRPSPTTTTPRAAPIPGVMATQPGGSTSRVAPPSRQVRGQGPQATLPTSQPLAAPRLPHVQQAPASSVVMATVPNTISSSDLAAIQLQVSTPSDNLPSVSTRAISDYLNNHSIETMMQMQ